MTVHSQLKSIATVAVKLGAVALMAASLSACVIAPIGHGYRHHEHSGPAVVEAAPVVVAPAVVVRPSIRHGYPRYYRY